MIARLRAAADRHPAAAALVAGLAFPLLGAGARILVRTPLDVRSQIPREAIGAALVLGIVWLFGWQRRTGLTARLVRPLNLALLALLLLVIWGLDSPALRIRGVHDVAAAAGLALLVGIVEETLVRGIVLTGFEAYGPLLAGAVSAVYFGLLHLGNLLVRPDPVVVAQAASALLIGLLFGAVRLRVRSLWPLVLTHALVDLPPLVTGILVPPPVPSPWLALLPVALVVPWGALGLGLLAWDEAHRK